MLAELVRVLPVAVVDGAAGSSGQASLDRLEKVPPLHAHRGVVQDAHEPRRVPPHDVVGGLQLDTRPASRSALPDLVEHVGIPVSNDVLGMEARVVQLVYTFHQVLGLHVGRWPRMRSITNVFPRLLFFLRRDVAHTAVLVLHPNHGP